jgi:hypothetical protein
MPNDPCDERQFRDSGTETDTLINMTVTERHIELHAALVARLAGMPLPTVLFRLAPSHLMDIERMSDAWLPSRRSRPDRGEGHDSRDRRRHRLRAA